MIPSFIKSPADYISAKGMLLQQNREQFCDEDCAGFAFRRRISSRRDTVPLRVAMEGVFATRRASSS